MLQSRHSGKKPSSPSAAAQALGEATLKIFFLLFFAFPCKQQSIYIYIYIYHKLQINRNISQTIFIYIYISQTTKFVRNSQYITNHTFKSTHYSKFTSSIHKSTPKMAHGVRCRRGLGRPSL
jgi:hypothetical protein